jgi:hypothetical protein
MRGRGRRSLWIAVAATAGTLVAVTIASIAVAGGGGPKFTAGSASGDISRWRVSFTESGVTPGSTVAYHATARASATYICQNYPKYDQAGNGHGAPQHFRIYRDLSISLSGTADLSGVVHKGGSGAEGFVAPRCSDGSTSSVASYGLYNVRIQDTTNHVWAPSLRGNTQPAPR